MNGPDRIDKMASNSSMLGNISPINSLAAFQILEENFISSEHIRQQAILNQDFTFAINFMVSNCGLLNNDGLASSEFIIMAGSAAEGLTPLYATVGSPCDLDWLLVIDSVSAKERLEDIDPLSSAEQCLVEYSEDNPGFAKLSAIGEIDGVWFDPNQTVYSTQNGCTYLSSSEVKIQTKIMMLNSVVRNIFSASNILDFFQITGPACTAHMRGLNFGFANGFSVKNIDLVMAVHFPSWPRVASEWIHRTRRHGWPKKEVIEAIVKQGSFLVPKGSGYSSSTNIEWTFTFSHVEPLLVKSMNDIMIKTYSILKLIKRYVLEDEIGEIISSYILKTALFWEAEEREKLQWQPHNLLQCVRNCLIRVESWFRSSFAPHYFIEGQNLIRHREEHVDRRKILECLRNLIGTLDVVFQNIPPFLYSLQRRHIHEIIENYYGGQTISLNSHRIDEMWQRVLSVFMLFLPQMSILFGNYFNRKTVLNLYQLESFRRRIIQTFRNHADTPVQLIYCSVLILKKISLELQVLKASSTSGNKLTYRRKGLIYSLRKINEATHPFIILGNCVQCLIQYVHLNNHLMFQKSVHDVQNYFRRCSPVRMNTSDVHSFLSNFVTAVQSYNAAKENENGIIFITDIHITEFELNFLPSILRLELECRFGLNQDSDPFFRSTNEFVVTVDAEVFFYFLCFCFYHMKDKNIEKLTFLKRLEASCRRSSTNWLHMAWNLLGYCRSQMGLYKDALKAYFESVVYQNNNPDVRTLSKATPWHVAILLNKCHRQE